MLESWCGEEAFHETRCAQEGSCVGPFVSQDPPLVSLVDSQCSKRTQAECAPLHQQERSLRIGYITCRPLDLGQIDDPKTPGPRVKRALMALAEALDTPPMSQRRTRPRRCGVARTK
jgi:hypothetical protein